MQGTSWMGILRTIPAEQHDKLVLITHNNTEIHLQGVVQLEQDFLVVRGRLAASTEAGRVFFIPFDQVHYVAFRDGMKENVILDMLGLEAAVSSPTPAVAAPETATEAAQEETRPGDTPAQTAAGDTARVGQGSGVIAKAALLERLRRGRGPETSPRPPTP